MKNLAVVVLLAVIAALLWVFVLQPRMSAPGSAPGVRLPVALKTVSIYVGGEKMRFLENPETKRLLAEGHGLAINSVKAGSVEMARELDLAGKDALWPSNDIAVEFFRMRGGKARATDIVFNSPIVIYTGWAIANALIREGLVEKRDDGYYIVKFPGLLALCQQKKKWKDLGLNFFGNVTVRCTDPTRSNSGNMFAGLVANMMNNTEVVNENSVETVLPQLKEFFSQLGLMEHSSEDIFRKFIATGVNNSMVVGYENQLVEFLIANPGNREPILRSVCVLYPLPTVWSSHPIIALNENGTKLIEAMRDGKIQDLAWRMHGFRSGLAGVTQNPSALGIPFLPEQIESVIPLPTAQAMDRIVKALSAAP